MSVTEGVGEARELGALGRPHGRTGAEGEEGENVLDEATLAGIARDVSRGLTGTPKTLPSYLFYDARGSLLYEEITGLAEYYPTRAEASIFHRSSDAIVLSALAHIGATAALTVVELGAGSCAKSEILLRALSRQQPAVTFIPVDISAAALALATSRLARELPRVDVQPLIGSHEVALQELALTPTAAARSSRERAYLALYIGSSIGNYPDPEAIRLLSAMREALGPSSQLLLGTDLRKDPAVLVPAYDDPRGVTAAFNRNVLVRLNRELGAHFDPKRFEHRARWNDAASQMEMHLEARGAMDVRIDALGASFHFANGETIHTETSIKYDLARVDRLLLPSGFVRAETFYDEGQRVALHLARAH